MISSTGFARTIIQVPPLRQRLQEDPGELRQLLEHVVTGLVGEPAADLVDMVQKQPPAHSALRAPGREMSGNWSRPRGAFCSRATMPAASAVSRRTRGAVAGRHRSRHVRRRAVLAGYCACLYEKSGNYEAVARLTHLDRRRSKIRRATTGRRRSSAAKRRRKGGGAGHRRTLILCAVKP